jgi:hypothetical protein
MKRSTRAGLSILLIGAALMLPEVSLLGVDFSEFNPYIVLIPQLGIMLVALGWMFSD